MRSRHRGARGDGSSGGAGLNGVSYGGDGSDPAPLRVSDVCLLTSDHGEPVSVPNLSLVFDGSGLTVAKGSGEVVTTIPWEAVSGLGTEVQLDHPAGEVTLRVSTASRSHSFVVPLQDEGSFDDRLARLARHYRTPAPSAGGEGAAAAAAVSPAEAAAPVPPEAAEAAAPVPPEAVEAAAPVPPEAAAPAGEQPVPARSRRSWLRPVLWTVVAVLVAAVLAFVGVYLAQREGAIDILPNGIAAAPPSAARVARAPAAGVQARAATATTRPRPVKRVPVIPGMSVSEVTGMAEGQGFSCTQVHTTSVDCSKPSRGAVVRVTSPDGQGVSAVSATVAGAPGSAGGAAVLEAVGSLPYEGGSPATAAQWVGANLHQSAATRLGPAGLKLVVTPGETVVELSPAGVPA